MHKYKDVYPFTWGIKLDLYLLVVEWFGFFCFFKLLLFSALICLTHVHLRFKTKSFFFLLLRWSQPFWTCRLSSFCVDCWGKTKLKDYILFFIFNMVLYPSKGSQFKSRDACIYWNHRVDWSLEILLSAYEYWSSEMMVRSQGLLWHVSPYGLLSYVAIWMDPQDFPRSKVRCKTCGLLVLLSWTAVSCMYELQGKVHKCICPGRNAHQGICFRGHSCKKGCREPVSVCIHLKMSINFGLSYVSVDCFWLFLYSSFSWWMYYFVFNLTTVT